MTNIEIQIAGSRRKPKAVASRFRNIRIFKFQSGKKDDLFENEKADIRK